MHAMCISCSLATHINSATGVCMSDMHTGVLSSWERVGPWLRESTESTAHVIDRQRVPQSFLQPRIMMEQNTCASPSFANNGLNVDRSYSLHAMCISCSLLTHLYSATGECMLGMHSEIPNPAPDLYWKNVGLP